MGGNRTEKGRTSSIILIKSKLNVGGSMKNKAVAVLLILVFAYCCPAASKRKSSGNCLRGYD
jgi:hypothetical protein